MRDEIMAKLNQSLDVLSLLWDSKPQKPPLLQGWFLIDNLMAGDEGFDSVGQQKLRWSFCSFSILTPHNPQTRKMTHTCACVIFLGWPRSPKLEHYLAEFAYYVSQTKRTRNESRV